MRIAVSDSTPRKCVFTPLCSSNVKRRDEMALLVRPFSPIVPFFLPSKAVAESLKSWT